MNALPARNLATGQQLWRLNQLGRLAVVAGAEPIDSEQGKVLVAAELERLGRTSFPRPGETYPDPK